MGIQTLQSCPACCKHGPATQPAVSRAPVGINSQPPIIWHLLSFPAKAGAAQALVEPPWHRYRSWTDSTAPGTRERGLHPGWLGGNPPSKTDASGREGIEQVCPGGICSLPESQAHCGVSFSGGRKLEKAQRRSQGPTRG